MEYETLDLSLHGWPAVEEPDFTYGAKAASSLLPATTDINYNDLPTDMPEWMETRENLGWDQLSPFEEVILPENQNFGPDDLFKDLPLAEEVLQEITQDVVDLKQDAYLDYNSTVSSISNEPEKIVICVRRVTIPKVAVKVPKEFSLVSYTGKSHEQTSQPCSLLTIPKAIQSPSPLRELDDVDREKITLKQALGLSDADEILNQLVTLVEENKTISLQEDEERLSDVSSWGSEPCSPASSVESVTSFQDNLFENLTPDKFETELLQISPLPSNDKTGSKSKQQGRKTSHVSSHRLEPYATNKRDRKREQNKQAATRYRQKKKKEEDLISKTLNEEEDRNKQLNEKYNGIKQELTYLKKIMREVFIAKGVISADAFKKSSKS